MVYMVTQLTFNQWVTGSNPVGLTINTSKGYSLYPFSTLGYRNYTYLISDLKPTYLKLKKQQKKCHFWTFLSCSYLVVSPNTQLIKKLQSVNVSCRTLSCSTDS